MGEFLRHDSCTRCGSSDANAIYADGSSYCFSCKTTTPPGTHDAEPETKVRKQVTHLPELTVPTENVRGLHPDTFRLYGVGYTQDKKFCVFPYYDLKGSLVGYKTRDKDKRFSAQGNPQEMGFFGLNAIGGNKLVIITEGEIDAMSSRQMTGYTSISIPHGAGSAKRSIQRQLMWLEQFETIVLCFDSDKPGQDAINEVVPLITPGKVRVATLEYKDANEYLQKGLDEQFKRAIWNATAPLCTGVLSASENADLVVEFLTNKEALHGVPTGYKGLDTLIGGWRDGEVHVLIAGTGIGKSTLARCLAHHAAKHEHVLYCPLEDMVSVALTRFMSMKLKVDLIKEEHGYNADALRNVVLSIQQNMTVFHMHQVNFRGENVDPVEELLRHIVYAIRMSGAKFVVIDHISVLASMGTNERKSVDSVMTLLQDAAIRYNCTVLCVSHLSRDATDKTDNAPSLSRVKFSSAIAQTAHTVLGVTRNRDSDDNRMTVHTLKQNRLWGVSGKFMLRWSDDNFILEEVFDTGEDEPLPDSLFCGIIDDNEPVHIKQVELIDDVSKPLRTESLGELDTQPTGDDPVRNDDPGVTPTDTVQTRLDTEQRVDSGNEGLSATEGQEDVTPPEQTTDVGDSISPKSTRTKSKTPKTRNPLPTEQPDVPNE